MIKHLEFVDDLMHWSVLSIGLVAAFMFTWRWRRDPARAWLSAFTLAGVLVIP